jgi:hypothetical protein
LHPIIYRSPRKSIWNYEQFRTRIRRNHSAVMQGDHFRTLGKIYDQITGNEDARVYWDIPDTACRHLPRNFFAYLIANFSEKWPMSWPARA